MLFNVCAYAFLCDFMLNGCEFVMWFILFMVDLGVILCFVRVILVYYEMSVCVLGDECLCVGRRIFVCWETMVYF